MNKFHFLILLSVMIWFINAKCGDDTGKYGEVTAFSKDKPVKFPDFTLVFMGESDKTSTFDNGNKFTFHYYNFKLTSASDSKDIRWSSGTGEIGPIAFDFGANKYSIEMRYSEGLKKKLDDDELVITKLPQN